MPILPKGWFGLEVNEAGRLQSPASDGIRQVLFDGVEAGGWLSIASITSAVHSITKQQL